MLGHTFPPYVLFIDPEAMVYIGYVFSCHAAMSTPGGGARWGDGGRDKVCHCAGACGRSEPTDQNKRRGVACGVDARVDARADASMHALFDACKFAKHKTNLCGPRHCQACC